MNYRYRIESKVNMLASSKEYGRVFGWEVIDKQENRRVRSFLLCETDLMLASYPFTKQQAERCLKIARSNGWQG